MQTRRQSIWKKQLWVILSHSTVPEVQVLHRSSVELLFKTLTKVMYERVWARDIEALNAPGIQIWFAPDIYRSRLFTQEKTAEDLQSILP